MLTFDACFQIAFTDVKLAALDRMTKSLEFWDMEESPDLPQDYIKASAVYYALRDIEKDSL